MRLLSIFIVGLCVGVIAKYLKLPWYIALTVSALIVFLSRYIVSLWEDR